MSWGQIIMKDQFGPTTGAARLLANDDDRLLRAEAIAPTGNRWFFSFSKINSVTGGFDVAQYTALYAEARAVATYGASSDPTPYFIKQSSQFVSSYRHHLLISAAVTEYVLPPLLQGRIASARVRINGTFAAGDSQFYRFNIHPDHDHYATLGDWLDDAPDASIDIDDIIAASPNDLDIDLPESVVTALNAAGSDPVYLYHCIGTPGFDSPASLSSRSIGARTRLVVPTIT
jgi:hypothetical protein